MKKLVMCVMLLAAVISVTGCQTSKALCDDIAGTAELAAEKLQKFADEAQERDSDRIARKLARQQGILQFRLQQSMQAEKHVQSEKHEVQ